MVLWIAAAAIIIIALAALYILIFIKAVEQAAFLQWVRPQALTVGDWVAKSVKSNGKTIASPKDLGLEEHQIKKIQALYKQKKIKRVLIKIGVPFIPSFLFAYIYTLIFQNIIFF